MRRPILYALGAVLGVIALGAVASLVLRAQAPPASEVPGTTAQEAIDAAAAALGGADRLRALRNITVMGYGQYAYQNGGGNITSLPDAPLKLIAANVSGGCTTSSTAGTVSRNDATIYFRSRRTAVTVLRSIRRCSMAISRTT